MSSDFSSLSDKGSPEESESVSKPADTAGESVCLDQSLSIAADKFREMVLVTTDPEPQDTNTSVGSAMDPDPFARERQKRLLPSNTVTLASSASPSGSSEGHQSKQESAPALSGRTPVIDEHQQRQEEMCQTLIRDMNKYGVCVLDDFLGEQRGQKVLSEVVTMYSEGKFKDGQLVAPATKAAAAEIRDLKHIRGDKITWIGGREPGCSNIGYLINQVSGVSSSYLSSRPEIVLIVLPFIYRWTLLSRWRIECRTMGSWDSTKSENGPRYGLKVNQRLEIRV